MKKLLVLLIVLLLVSPALAATKHKKKKAKRVATPVSTPVETPEATPVATPVAKPVAETSNTSTNHWVLQIQGGPDLLLSSLGGDDSVTINNPGFGFSGSFGYAPDNDWVFSFLMGYQVSAITYSVTDPGEGTSLAYTPMQLVFQYNFPGENVRFYGLLGAGLALNSFTHNELHDGITSWQGINETDFLLSPGIGIAFNLSGNMNLFVQTKLDMDFYSQKIADLMTDKKKFDTPQLTLPIQIGLSFSLN